MLAGDKRMTQIISDEIILNYINNRKTAETENISMVFNISESTVKRALTRLEKSNRIIRYKGGAIAQFQGKTGYDFRAGSYMVEKDSIAKEAARYIKNGSSIILLGGTTLCGVCPYIYDMKLNVITNSLSVVDRLKGAAYIKIIVLGGIYNHDEYELYGDVTARGLHIMYADILFASCVGCSPEVGFMTDLIESIGFYQLCMKNARQKFILADSSKMGRSGLAIFANVSDVDYLITDGGISREYERSFNDNGVCVVRAAR